MQCINKNPTIYHKIIIQLMQIYCLKCKILLKMTSPKFHIPLMGGIFVEKQEAEGLLRKVGLKLPLIIMMNRSSYNCDVFIRVFRLLMEIFIMMVDSH